MLYGTPADQNIRHSQLKMSLESALADGYRFSGELSELRRRSLEYAVSLQLSQL